MKRPLGVTIIAILSTISGIFGIIGGMGIMALFGTVNRMSMGLGMGKVATYPLFSGTMWGLILVILGIISLIGAYGAWNLRKWAWPLLVGLFVFGIIQNLVFISSTGSSSILGIAINGAILYYLFQVKESFTQ